MEEREMNAEREINPEFEGNFHGISESQLLNASSNEVTNCPACSHILWNPQMCSVPTCGITFCQPCLKESLKTKEICTNCNKRAQYETNTFLKNRILSKLEFKCKNNPKCEIIMKYEDLPYHICPYNEISCEIEGCEWRGEKKELGEHLHKCEYVRIRCKNKECKLSIRRGLLQEHYLECLYESIECVNKCGRFSGIRINMEQHLLSECIYTRIFCTYRDRGCGESPLRSDLEIHMDECGYAPQLLECGHQVNRMNVLEHTQNCLQFPAICPNCTFASTKGDIQGHQCLPFLFHKIEELEAKLLHDAQYYKEQIRDLTNALELEAAQRRRLEMAMGKGEGGSK